MIEKKTTDVHRPKALPRDDLTLHLKAIGQAIIDDADKLAGIGKASRIGITAMIAPLTEVTKVRYTVERIAEPGPLTPR